MDFEELPDSVVFNGVEIAKTKGLLTPRILRSMRLGRYETAELRAVKNAIQPDERILEIGAGIGYLSTHLARLDEVSEILAVEANPDLVPAINDTFKRNNVSNKTRCLHGILSGKADADGIDFYLRKNFWASSLSSEGRAYVRTETVPVHCANDVISDFAPTLIICDIEGGELDLFTSLDPGTATRIVIELHPGIYGHAGVKKVFEALHALGYVMDMHAPRTGDVLSFCKVAAEGVVK